MPIQWPRPKLASVDDIPSWEHAAPTLAVSFGRLQEEKWLKAWPGGNLDAKDEEGWSALQRAAAAGLAVAVKELLRRPSVEVNGVEPARGQTALFLASRLGHAAVVRVLLACSEVVVNYDIGGGYTALLVAAQNGHEAVVELLLAHAALDANQVDPIGRTPLWMAAMKNDEAIVRLLLAHPAVDAERANQWGDTPLLAACETRSTAAALALLEAKADPNARDNRGDSPLVVARRGDNAQLLAALVAAGADVAALYPPLVAKCMLGDAHAARSLLLEAPKKVKKAGLPPLVVACLRGDAAALAALDGSDACEAGADGLPPAFCFAVELGDAAVVKAVLAGTAGLDEPQRAVLCAQAARAAGTHDAAASGYVPGAAPSTPQERHMVRARAIGLTLT